MKQLDIGKLEEIKKRWDLATPGPWRRGNSFDVFVDSEGAKKGEYGFHIADCDPDCSKPYEQGKADANAIASAPTDIAWLISTLKKVVQSDDPVDWKQRALASEAKVVELELQCSKAQTLLQEKTKLIERMACVIVGELEILDSARKYFLTRR